MTRPTDMQIDKALAFLQSVVNGAANSNDAAEHALWKAYLALHPSEDTHPEFSAQMEALIEEKDAQATITELVEALEPLIKLAWEIADLPNDLPVIVAAQDAVAKAKAQIDG